MAESFVEQGNMGFLWVEEDSSVASDLLALLKQRQAELLEQFYLLP